MIGIVVAMESEAAPLLEKEVGAEVFCGRKFHSLNIDGREVVLAISGIGKVNAAFTATLLIEKYRPEVIINFGVSGGLCLGIKRLDLVAATAAVQHDADTSPLGDPKGLVSTVNTVYFPTDERYTRILCNIDGVKSGVIACGDQFVADAGKKREINSLFNAVVCDMESGAIAHCAMLANVKFVSLRCVSDVGSDSAAEEYGEFLPKAALKLCDAVTKFIGELPVE